MADPTSVHDFDERAEQATLADLRRLGAVPPPRADFARSLKEELMHAPAARSTFAPGADRRPLPGTGGWRPRVRALRHSALGALATAALLAVTLIGVYLAVLAPRDPEPRPPTSVAAYAPPAGATPAADLTLPTNCETTDVYFGCPEFAIEVGWNQIVLANIDQSARAANRVQLQGWAIAPGAALSGPAADDAAHGVVVDAVLTGTYVATFDVPVVIDRGAVTNDPDQIEYLDAGATVELGRGDSISYQLGGLREIHNPLRTQRIEFKRAVIYDGDVSAFAATADGVSMRVEAEGTLPRAVGEAKNGYGVEFWYVWVNGAFPPPAWANATILGPVDPQRAPQGVDGFVLVISDQNRG